MEKKNKKVAVKPEPARLETENVEELKESALEQVGGTLPIGSQGTGAGAGKKTFNPFSIKGK